MISIIAFVKCVNYASSMQYGPNADLYDINPYDIYMIHQLIRLKKTIPCKITSVTMGPLLCRNVLKQIIGWGIDKCVLITDKSFVGSDTFATSYILSKYIMNIGEFDICSFGEKAIDGETGQVPIAFACRQNKRCITGVNQIISIENGEVILEREGDNKVEIVSVNMPSILAFQGKTTERPTGSLFDLKKAFNYEPIVIDNKTINADYAMCGHNGSKTVVLNRAEFPKRANTFVHGSLETKARFLKEILFQ